MDRSSRRLHTLLVVTLIIPHIGVERFILFVDCVRATGGVSIYWYSKAGAYQIRNMY